MAAAVSGAAGSSAQSKHRRPGQQARGEPHHTSTSKCLHPSVSLWSREDKGWHLWATAQSSATSQGWWGRQLHTSAFVSRRTLRFNVLYRWIIQMVSVAQPVHEQKLLLIVYMHMYLSRCHCYSNLLLLFLGLLHHQWSVYCSSRDWFCIFLLPSSEPVLIVRRTFFNKIYNNCTFLILDAIESYLQQSM